MSGDKRGPFYNSVGYADPTAYHAIKIVTKEERDLEEKAKQLVKALKTIAELADMQIINRIELRDNKTGRIYR